MRFVRWEGNPSGLPTRLLKSGPAPDLVRKDPAAQLCRIGTRGERQEIGGTMNCSISWEIRWSSIINENYESVNKL
jgi:hypothetical protein